MTGAPREAEGQWLLGAGTKTEDLAALSQEERRSLWPPLPVEEEVEPGLEFTQRGRGENRHH